MKLSLLFECIDDGEDDAATGQAEASGFPSLPSVLLETTLSDSIGRPPSSPMVGRGKPRKHRQGRARFR